MAVLKQGTQYNDDMEPTPTDTPAPVEETGSKKTPKALIVVAIVVLFIMGVFAISKVSGRTESPAVSDVVDPTTPVDEDAYWDAFEEPEDSFSYSQEEIESLRAWGYTGDEIEAKELEEVPAASLIAASKKAQEEKLKTLGDVTSPEYQELLNSTWLGQEPMALPAYVEGVSENELSFATRTYNADYVKVPAHGRTLFLKVFLEDGSYTFMECDLLRYIQLPDSGNIVVTYSEITLGDVVVISGMTEVEVG